MEPGFFLSYWRPWDDNSSLIDSWGDYVRDKSMVEYGSDRIGEHIRRASREQINAIEEASRQQVAATKMQTLAMAKIGEAQIKAIQQAAKYVGAHLSEVQKELSFLNRRMDISIEQQRLGLILQKNIAELLKIPDSEKERQQTITLGIQFFVNASKDPDLFDDALEQFLKAEQMKKQDYFVLHRIGCIYLYAEKHLNPQLAIDYFTRAGKYAAVESNPDALRLVNILTNPINEAYTQLTSDPKQIMLLAAYSYEKAALASYIIGDDKSAVSFQEKALMYDKSAQNSFNLSKYLIRAGQSAQAMKYLEWAIDEDPSMMDAVFCDADIAGQQETIDLVKRKNDEVDVAVEEIVLESFKLASLTSGSSLKDLLEKVRCNELATSSNFVKKRYALKEDIEKNYRYIEELNIRISKYKEDGVLPSNVYSKWTKVVKDADYVSIRGLMEAIESLNDELLSGIKEGNEVNSGTIFYVDNTKKKVWVYSDRSLETAVFDNYEKWKSDMDNARFDAMTAGKIDYKKLIGDGLSNTKIILNTPRYADAARLCQECCNGGFHDWFLPSKEELERALQVIDIDLVFWTSSYNSVSTLPDCWIYALRKTPSNEINNIEVSRHEQCYVLPIRVINLE